jgi:phosphoribosylaminoimidazolecarboxamide formyltransferase/IMP cyclohydrolase
VVVKHNNPCGVAVDRDVATAYVRAREADATSAFGGIVAVNREVDEALAKLLVETFLECVVAPSYSAAARDVLSSKKNPRLVAASGDWTAPTDQLAWSIRTIAGGAPVQTVDHGMVHIAAAKVATPPAEPRPVAAAPPGDATDTAREVQRVLARQTALDGVVKSRGELALGNLDGAQRLLDGSREVLETVSGDAKLQSQIDELRAELSQVGDALARAQALAKRGDCTGAIRVYDEILKGHAGIKQARAAREQCKRMLPPSLAE